MTSAPIDVWLKFEEDTDEMAAYEANTFMTDTGYGIQWYHNDVGLVMSEYFDTLADAYSTLR